APRQRATGRIRRETTSLRLRKSESGGDQPPESALRQERFDDPLGLGVSTFADTNEADEPALVDEIECGPGTVAVAVPGREVVVDGHRVRDRVLAEVASNVVDVSLVAKLRSMNTDHDEP